MPQQSLEVGQSQVRMNPVAEKISVAGIDHSGHWEANSTMKQRQMDFLFDWPLVTSDFCEMWICF